MKGLMLGNINHTFARTVRQHFLAFIIMPQQVVVRNTLETLHMLVFQSLYFLLTISEFLYN